MDFKLFSIERRGFFRKFYEIFDEEGVLVYTMRPLPFSFMRKFKIEDHNGLEVMQLTRPFKFFTMAFELNNYDERIAEIKRLSKIVKNELEILSKYGPYHAVGNFWKNEFTILKNSEEVAKISRTRSMSRRSYGLAIKADQEPLFVIGIALCIEIMIRVIQSRNSG